MSSASIFKALPNTSNPAYRVKIYMGWAGDGDTETYITPPQAPANLVPLINQMLGFRAQFMYTNQYIQGVSLSQVGSSRHSTLLLPLGGPWFDAGAPPGNAIRVPAQGTYNSGIEGVFPTEFRAVIQVKLGFDTPARYATRYVSGIPAAMIQGEPATLNFSGAARFLVAMNNFYTYLQNNGFQVAGQNISSPTFRINAILQNAPSPNLIGTQLSTAGSPSFSPGDRIKIQGTRPAKGTRGATINGRWSIASVDSTTVPGFVTLYLQNSQTISPSQIRLTGNTSIVQAVVTQNFAINNYIIFRAGIKKRGKPSLSPRGRRLTRYTLDP